jgi:hypothetical protein
VVGGDGIGGAGVDAAAAGAAVVGEGGVGGEIEIEDHFAEEEPGAVVGVDEEGVFADPAEAGAGGEFALEEGAGVGVAAGEEGFGFGVEEVAEASFEGAEFSVDDFVVVASPGVAGDFSDGAGVWWGFGRGLVVGEADAEDALGPREFLGDVDTLMDALGEVVHGAVLAFVDPAGVGVGVGGRGGAGDSDEIESRFARHRLERRGEGVRGDRGHESIISGGDAASRSGRRCYNLGAPLLFISAFGRLL